MDRSSPERGKTPVEVPNSFTPKQIRWTYELEHVFLELLLQQEKLGNRVGGTFTPQAYRNMLHEMQGTYGTRIQKKHLKDKIRTLKQQYSEFKDAFRGMSGFSWNWNTKKFEAEPSIWESLIQDNPSAASFRGKSCIHWDNMNLLWSASRATCNEAAMATECCKNLDDQFNSMTYDAPLQDINFPNISTNMHMDEGSPNLVGAISDQGMSDASTSQPSTGRAQTKSKRKASSIDLEDEMVRKNISISLDNASRALVESAEILASKVARLRPSNTILFTALRSMNLEDSFLLDCYEYLAKNDVEAEMFLGTHESFRDEMLKRIMKKRR